MTRAGCDTPNVSHPLVGTPGTLPPLVLPQDLPERPRAPLPHFPLPGAPLQLVKALGAVFGALSLLQMQGMLPPRPPLSQSFLLLSSLHFPL